MRTRNVHTSKNYPLKSPSRTAPPFFMPPQPNHPAFLLPSTATPSLGLTAHPLPLGYSPSIPSSQQQHLPALPISTANSSLDAQPNPRYAFKTSSISRRAGFISFTPDIYSLDSLLTPLSNRHDVSNRPEPSYGPPRMFAIVTFRREAGFTAVQCSA